jgi:hypothetical protein
MSSLILAMLSSKSGEKEKKFIRFFIIGKLVLGLIVLVGGYFLVIRPMTQSMNGIGNLQQSMAPVSVDDLAKQMAKNDAINTNKIDTTKVPLSVLFQQNKKENFDSAHIVAEPILLSLTKNNISFKEGAAKLRPILEPLAKQNNINISGLGDAEVISTFAYSADLREGFLALDYYLNPTIERLSFLALIDSQQGKRLSGLNESQVYEMINNLFITGPSDFQASKRLK